MNARRLLLIVSMLAGAFGGRSALEIAADTRPPMRWADLEVVFGGTLVSLVFVLGVQIALRNARAVRWGWIAFLCIAVYLLGAGVAAAVLAAPEAQAMPQTWLFLVIGVAMLCGLGFVRIVFRRSFVGAKTADV